ncbi:MAG: hypothetical protein GY847_04545, partial [Proteobacteria bacterium]|nr:hypothetical protein [Pseudomonadota bacterium]
MRRCTKATMGLLFYGLSCASHQNKHYDYYFKIECVIRRCRFVEKGNVEVLLFTLQSRMRANNQKPYLPREGKLLADINRAWEHLEKAEHERELSLKEELIRQEKLEQLAARFDRKASMHEMWLSENQRLVSQDNFGTDLASVEAATKKHEAIEMDIYAYKECVQAVVAFAAELEAEDYHDIDRINERSVSGCSGGFPRKLVGMRWY